MKGWLLRLCCLQALLGAAILAAATPAALPTPTASCQTKSAGALADKDAVVGVRATVSFQIQAPACKRPVDGQCSLMVTQSGSTRTAGTAPVGTNGICILHVLFSKTGTATVVVHFAGPGFSPLSSPSLQIPISAASGKLTLKFLGFAVVDRHNERGFAIVKPGGTISACPGTALGGRDLLAILSYSGPLVYAVEGTTTGPPPTGPGSNEMGNGQAIGVSGTTYGLSAGTYVARIATGVDPQIGLPAGQYSGTFDLALENPHKVVPNTTVSGSVTVSCSGG